MKRIASPSSATTPAATAWSSAACASASWATAWTVGRASAAAASSTVVVRADTRSSRASSASRRLLRYVKTAALRDLPPQLEREQRVASRELVHARQLRPGQIGAEAIVQQPVQLAHAQRGRSHLVSRARRRTAPPARTAPARRRLADRRQHLQPLAGHPAQRERQHARRGGVQPLQVVDRHEHVALGTECRQDVQEREPDRLRRGRFISRLVQEQGDPQRPPSRRGQRPVDLVQHGPDEIGEPRERECRLRLRRAVHQHRGSVRRRILDRDLPQQRLADPRLAAQHERLQLRAGEEPSQSIQLRLTGDDASREHGSSEHPRPRGRRFQGVGFSRFRPGAQLRRFVSG